MNKQPIEGAFPIRLDNPRAWRTYLGGRGIDALHGIEGGKDGHFPEEWIMSLVTARNAGREDVKDEGLSHLYGSELTLKEVIERDPVRYLGHSVDKDTISLGVLVKLIDSAERLTLQVHPDKKRAMELFHSPYGKTECWHILGCREINGQKPCVYLGFKPGVTREEWKKCFDEQDLERMLDCVQRYDVEPGDTILIRGGMPHAIGAGCFLAEIQEPTDYTIRVERTTPNGFQVDDYMCHQGLGFKRMFDAFDYTERSRDDIYADAFIKAKLIDQSDGGYTDMLIGYDTTRLFRLDKITVNGTYKVESSGAFCGLYVLDGTGCLTANGCTAQLEKASQYFVPSGTGAFVLSAEGEKPLEVLRFFGPKEP